MKPTAVSLGDLCLPSHPSSWIHLLLLKTVRREGVMMGGRGEDDGLVLKSVSLVAV